MMLLNAKRESRLKLASFVLLLIVFMGCETPPERKKDDSRKRMVVYEEPFPRSEIEERADYFRSQHYLGTLKTTDSCNNEYRTGADYILGLFKKCKETYMVRLKLTCETDIGMQEPLLRPLRYKNIKLDITPSENELRSEKLFPKYLTTDSEGVIEALFMASESLPEMKLVLERNHHTQTLDSFQIGPTIRLRPELCGENK